MSVLPMAESLRTPDRAALATRVVADVVILGVVDCGLDRPLGPAVAVRVRAVPPHVEVVIVRP